MLSATESRPATPTGPTRARARTLLLALVALGVGAIATPAGVAAAAVPTIAAVSPNNGALAGGTDVTITGTGFKAAGASTVEFGGVTATPISLGESEIKVVSPAGTRGELVNVNVNNANGTSAAVPKDQFAYDPSPAAVWLGLDGNSSGIASAQLGEFVKNNVDYDRGGAPGLDWPAGEILTEGGKTTSGGRALAVSVAAGMIPDITIEYQGYAGNYVSDPDFPQERSKKEEGEGKETIRAYVAAFIKSAKAIHERYPSALFEPMNEPWGYTTPQYNAAEYADVIASLLPEALAAGISLSSIYVAATGKNCTNPARPGECAYNGWVPAMYAAQPKLETEIQGWYFHPYGPPSGAWEGDSSGIQSVPVVQSVMNSGQNNIIVSEVGYCATRVNHGAECGGRGEGAGKAAHHLTQMLDNALPYHEAGWLRALIVYARNGGGWAMQFTDAAKLTKSGKALDAFAGTYASASVFDAYVPLIESWPLGSVRCRHGSFVPACAPTAAAPGFGL